MSKENDISFFDFLDFEVFALPDKKSDLLNKNNAPKANILVVYFNDKNDNELDVLLQKIFAAVNLEINKDIILLKTTTEEKYSFNEIQEKMSVNDLLFFGVKPSNFGLNYSIEPYHPLAINNLRILLLNSLEEISKDVNKKKALWSCIKEMYTQDQNT